MNRVRSQTGGYTIVETLIFLAVSSVIAMGALLLMGGQQRKTEFSQSVRETELIIQDIMNDVSTGNFPSPSDVTCTPTGPGGAPRVEVGAGEQGTNQACTLIGRVLQFQPSSGTNADYRTFSVAGLTGNINNITSSLSEARPTLITQTSLTTRIPYGSEIRSISAPGLAGCTNPYAIAFITNFADYDSGTLVLESNARNVDVFPLCGVGPGADEAAVQTATSSLSSPSAFKNPSGGIQICLDDGGSQRGLIIVGGQGRQFTTTSEIGAVC